MRYAGIIKNDISAAPGVCVSFFTQGCPFHCIGCHNPETWDYDGGKEFTSQTLDELISLLSDNGVHRNLCIMGGEPLCDENLNLVEDIIFNIKKTYSDVVIYLWTGYELEELLNDSQLYYILNNIDYLIDGPFISEKRDITLQMRGSSNQRIIDMSEEDLSCMIDSEE